MKTLKLVLSLVVFLFTHKRYGLDFVPTSDTLYIYADSCSILPNGSLPDRLEFDLWDNTPPKDRADSAGYYLLVLEPLQWIATNYKNRDEIKQILNSALSLKELREQIKETMYYLRGMPFSHLLFGAQLYKEKTVILLCKTAGGWQGFGILRWNLYGDRDIM